MAAWSFGVPPFNAEMIQVIRTTLEKRGEGTKDSPVRRITQYWSLDGELLAEVDPASDEFREREVRKTTQGTVR